jgi:hypothetical protein
MTKQVERANRTPEEKVDPTKGPKKSQMPTAGGTGHRTRLRKADPTKDPEKDPDNR